MNNLSTIVPVDFSLGKAWSMDQMPEVAKVIQSGIRSTFPRKSDAEMMFGQVLDVAEEAGEFVGAFRRNSGLARRYSTMREVEDELADVIIASFVCAEYLNTDLSLAVHRKAQVVLSRGYKEG